jgi:hypothetical protein
MVMAMISPKTCKSMPMPQALLNAVECFAAAAAYISWPRNNRLSHIFTAYDGGVAS